jgi:hypothetical protein
VSVMEPLPVALTKIIKFTAEVCGLLSEAGVPGAGIVQAALKLISFVADDFASGLDRLNIAFKEISSDGGHKGTVGQPAGSHFPDS